MKKKVIIGILLMVLFWGLLWAFLIQKPDYDYGINVKFELDTPVEYEYAIAEQYVEQYNAELLDDSLPHNYTLVFPDMAEHQVRAIVGILMDTDYVLSAIYTTVTMID